MGEISENTIEEIKFYGVARFQMIVSYPNNVTISGDEFEPKSAKQNGMDIIISYKVGATLLDKTVLDSGNLQSVQYTFGFTKKQYDLFTTLGGLDFFGNYTLNTEVQKKVISALEGFGRYLKNQKSLPFSGEDYEGNDFDDDVDYEIEQYIQSEEFKEVMK